MSIRESYTLDEILNVLEREDSDGAYRAMSELTGLSSDALLEMQEMRKEKEKKVRLLCGVGESKGRIVILTEEAIALLREGNIEPVRDVLNEMVDALVKKLESGDFTVRLSACDGRNELVELSVKQSEFGHYRQKKVYAIDWHADKYELEDFQPPKEVYVSEDMPVREINDYLEKVYGLPVDGFLLKQ